jgi:hypothetical protein
MVVKHFTMYEYFMAALICWCKRKRKIRKAEESETSSHVSGKSSRRATDQRENINL